MDADEELEVARASIEVAAPIWRRRLKLFAPVLLVIAVAAAWYFGDLRALNSPDKVAAAAESLRASPWAIVYVIVAFAIGSLLFFPITALMAGAALAFDTLHGFLYAYLGALCAAMITYWVGRLLGTEILRYVRGPKIERFQRELQTHAFRASLAARFVPVGSFAMLNMLAGSLHVPFRWYVLGNMVGILPGALILTLFADQLAAAAQHADKPRLLAVGGALLVIAVVYFFWRRRVRRQRRATLKESLAE
ncbi:MAG TPA: VTT domain-containing protein [Polyangiales bacterium]|nr:VTT domain-containing protein [Polyangiales bacterium]